MIEKVLMDRNEFQNYIIEYIKSDEFNQHYNSMKFTDDKQAFMQGLVWAALLTVRISPYYLEGDDNENYE